MVKDAESHADEDRRQRELAEARNTAENAAYQAEKQLGEMGDQIDSDAKSEIESAIKDVREALASDDAEEIKAKTDALQAGLPQGLRADLPGRRSSRRRGDGDGAGGDGAGGEEEEVVDAEVVDDERSSGGRATIARTGPPTGSRPTRPQPDAGASEPQDRVVRGASRAGAARIRPELVDGDLDALLTDTQRERDEYLELAQRTRADFENYRRRAARRRGGRAARQGRARPRAGPDRSTTWSARCARRGSTRRPRTTPRRPETAAGLAHGRGARLRRAARRARARRRRDLRPHRRAVRPDVARGAGDPRRRRRREPGIVLETLEKGYRLDGQVLRAARVVVSE